MTPARRDVSFVHLARAWGAMCGVLVLVVAGCGGSGVAPPGGKGGADGGARDTRANDGGADARDTGVGGASGADARDTGDDTARPDAGMDAPAADGARDGGV